MDAASHGAERYRRLSLEPPAGKDIRGNEMHHEERTGMMYPDHSAKRSDSAICCAGTQGDASR
jgi:hypothetical protein